LWLSKQSYVFVRAYQDKELNVFNKISIDSINIEFSSKAREYPNSSEFKLKVQKLFKESSFSEIPILEKKAFLVDTTEIKKSNQLDRNEELKKAVDLIPKTNQLKGVKVIGKIELKTEKRKRNRGELDLHIEKLNVTFKGKSNGEIIQIQLNAAKSYIDQSILSGKREIILVHGVGSGRLKEELHKLLKSYYGIKYEQADSRNYGDGATMVHLKG
jgi:dsDNA-specific endonuclease/ATPase MutS2